MFILKVYLRINVLNVIVALYTIRNYLPWKMAHWIMTNKIKITL